MAFPNWSTISGGSFPYFHNVPSLISYNVALSKLKSAILCLGCRPQSVQRYFTKSGSPRSSFGPQGRRLQLLVMPVMNYVPFYKSWATILNIIARHIPPLLGGAIEMMFKSLYLKLSGVLKLHTAPNPVMIAPLPEDIY
jgi:hypothetical protein